MCGKKQSVQKHSREVALYQGKINTVRANLARGYYVYKECRKVPVRRPCRLRASLGHKHKKCVYGMCTYYREICKETPVALNLTLKKEKAVYYKKQLVLVQKNRKLAFGSCYKRVKKMNAEQAFGYYKN